MTLYRLRVFVCVAKHLNMTYAAQELHTTQPSVSRHLKTVQREYGVTLYRIAKNGIELTDEGKVFLKHAEVLIQQFDALKGKFNGDTHGANPSVLRIGGSFGAAVVWLPSAVARYKRIYPQTPVITTTESGRELEQQLLDSKLDLALLTRPSKLSPLVYELVGREKVVAIVSANYPIADKERLSVGDLGQVPLVIRSRLGDNISKVAARLKELEQEGVTLKIAMYCDSYTALLASVEEGVGVGFIRRGCLGKDLRQGRVKILRTPWLKVFHDNYAVYQKDRPISLAAQDFLTLLRKGAKKLGAHRSNNTSRFSER